MKTSSTIKILALAALMPVGAAAADLPPLAENERVRTEFLAGAVGDEIVDNCPDMAARMMVVIGKLNDLNNYARSLGYTSAQIRDFRKSDENKARLNAMRDDYLAANGVVPGDAESYCRLGRQEIEQGTLIGSLLRER
ncbi:MAG: DUF5333 domain-containing protein [Rhodobacteraceae bacterium]|jgi:hypothetical protein|nr:DUF5333 domain-containing protein [Paracoccaceae bacterium]